MSKPKFEITHECADMIALASLKECRDYHLSELKRKADDPSYWIHEEDQALYLKYINASEILIHYYGG
jgi:hypothetical protein